MTKTIEQWLLFTFEHGEFTPLSKPFKTKKLAREGALEISRESAQVGRARCDSDKEITTRATARRCRSAPTVTRLRDSRLRQKRLPPVVKSTRIEQINCLIPNAVPTRKSILIEIVAFTESRPVAFPDHADRTLLPARLFPSSRCSASRDSCTPASASGLAAFEPWA
jgi:hypothetical protein